MRIGLKNLVRDLDAPKLEQRLSYLKSKLGKRKETNQMKYIKFHLRKRKDEI